MVMPQRLYVEKHETYPQDAESYQQALAEFGVIVEICLVEQINAKFLRQHPELSLVVDADGLSLAVNGMKMNPDWQAEIPRLQRASLKSEMLARVCQANQSPTVIDATAGLGHDALLLARFGAKVILLERHPILFLLLQSQLKMAQQHQDLADIVQGMQCIFVDANQYLSECKSVDVVYLDPMFPQRHQHGQKKAQVKKQMQILHHLLEQDDVDDEQNSNHVDLGDALLPLAQQCAKRVIVKRPKHAIFLNQQPPQHQWIGESCRFDGYFQV